MNKITLTLFSALFLAACDGSNGTTPVNQPDAANNTSNPSVEVLPTNSFVGGTISLLNDAAVESDIIISVRGLDISSTMQSNGEFELTLPITNVARTVTLDISGSEIIPKSVPVQIPALAEMALIDTSVAGRTAAITFNLESGGQLQNPESPTRTSVSVPANAFQFSDGTIATGNAQVSITEVDIEDLYGESAWAPNLVGIAEGMNQPAAIWTYGMSDFYFSQNGQKLQLREGVNANIKMDLLYPYLITDTASFPEEPANATDGSTIPLWYYDTVDMVWKEEGVSTVIQDDSSDSGFSTSGDVSHFTYWNIDHVFPEIQAKVVVVIVDLFGRPRNDLVIESYTTTARIPPETGLGTYGETGWSNTQQLTPEFDQLLVMSNEMASNNLTMDIIVDNIMVKGVGKLNDAPIKVNKRFDSSNSDNTVYVEVLGADF